MKYAWFDIFWKFKIILCKKTYWNGLNKFWMIWKTFHSLGNVSSCSARFAQWVDQGKNLGEKCYFASKGSIISWNKNKDTLWKFIEYSSWQWFLITLANKVKNAWKIDTCFVSTNSTVYVSGLCFSWNQKIFTHFFEFWKSY